MNNFNKWYFRKYVGHENKPTFTQKLRNFQLKIAKHIKFFHIIFHYIQALPQWARILDIGCGRWVVLYTIRTIRPDLKLYGCDIGDVSEFYTSEIQFSQIWLDNVLPFSDESFDMIISTQVIEHLDHPVNLYKEAYRVLKDEGVAYIDTSSVKMLVLPGNLNFYVDPTHVRPFTQKWLWTLGCMSGLELVDWWYPRDYPINGIILALLFPVFGVLSILNSRFEPLFHGWVHFLLGSGIYGFYKKTNIK